MRTDAKWLLPTILVFQVFWFLFWFSINFWFWECLFGFFGSFLLLLLQLDCRIAVESSVEVTDVVVVVEFHVTVDKVSSISKCISIIDSTNLETVYNMHINQQRKIGFKFHSIYQSMNFRRTKFYEDVVEDQISERKKIACMLRNG